MKYELAIAVAELNEGIEFLNDISGLADSQPREPSSYWNDRANGGKRESWLLWYYLQQNKVS